jgi:hypothetical protein
MAIWWLVLGLAILPEGKTMTSAEGAQQRREQGVLGQAYLDSDGQLKHPLTLLDAQGGFVGLTGTLWSIERDGRWTRQRYIQRPVPGTEEAAGRLTRRQLARLASTLAEQDLAGLPQIVGQRQAANPHVFRLKFGTQETALELPAARPLPMVPPPGDPQVARFVTIVKAIREAMTLDSPGLTEESTP